MVKNTHAARAPKGPSRPENPETFERSKLDSLMERIASLLSEQERNQWLIGDLLSEAFGQELDGKRVTNQRLREAYPAIGGYSDPYLSQLRLTAEAFQGEAREQAIARGAAWYDCDCARRSRKDAVKRGVGLLDEPLIPHLDAILERRHSEKPNSRLITKRRIEKTTSKRQEERAEAAEQARQSNSDYLEFCLNRPCLEMLKTLEDRSAALVWLDPPYGQYDKLDDGSLARPYNGSILSDCDNSTRSAALRVTIEALQASERVMADKSALVLFQAATEPDRPEIILAAREAGFGYIFPMYWNKRLPQPSDFALPFSVQTERILVMARDRGAFYENENRKGRTDLLSDEVFARLYGKDGEAGLTADAPGRVRHWKARSEGLSPGMAHQMEKPAELCRFFLERLTVEGDLVLDLFGCSGSMACECIRHGRRWRYSESNKLNFELGLSRISASVE